MTGYGRKVITIDKTNITVEIRSVNHRFLDISTKMPRSLLVVEDAIKQEIKSHFLRGRLDVFITMEGEGFVQRKLHVDWDLIEQYVEHLKTIKERFQLSGQLSLDMMTKIEELFTIEESEQKVDSVKEALLNAVNNACIEVTEMRKTEGEQLAKDLVKRINLIENIVKMLGERRDIVIIEYRDRILKRIESYITENKELRSEESKVYQDVALLAEKGDITEEVTRLTSHAKQFLEVLYQGDAIGRKLDFITQEMHREANTIGSKSNDVQISECVVALKSEIEKVKEQIQNVE